MERTFFVVFIVILCSGFYRCEVEVFYENAAVAADDASCSKIGRDILLEGGHAVDAAVASLICCGVVNFHSTGISGGGFMTVYDRVTKKGIVFDYRETGPASIHENIYDVNPPDDRVSGGLAVGVPGVLRGLKKVHAQFGKLPWASLVEPSITLAENGTRIGKDMYVKMTSEKDWIDKDVGLKELLYFENGQMKNIGDLVFNKKYADTLRKVRDDPDALHTGVLVDGFLEEINSRNGNMTREDLKSYTPLVKDALTSVFNNKLTLYTAPLPSGGPLLIHILNMLEGYKWTKDYLFTFEEKLLTYHRITEAFKFTFATTPHLGDPDAVPDEEKYKFDIKAADIVNKRLAEEKRKLINDSFTQNNSFYDPFFAKSEDEGTTHVSILDKQGNAVSATNSINYAFGAKFRSMSTGIIFNNELADFFTKKTFDEKHPTPVYNAPKGGRRPLSSMSPTIIVNSDGDVVMVVGASGGKKIPLATAWVIMKKFWFGYTLSEAIEDVRIQHTLYPSYIRSEKEEGFGLSENLRRALEEKGHVVKTSVKNAIVQGIFVDGKKIYAKSDPRKGGVAEGY